MEFDWSLREVDWPATQQQIEECFEDPFGLRLMPDAERFRKQSRFFCLGKDNTGDAWTVVYAANGKMTRVVCVRPMAQAERDFYERKMRGSL